MKRIFDWAEYIMVEWILPSLLLIMVFGITLMGLWGLVSLFTSESEESKEKRIAETKPHVYAEVDGCTVYKWLADGRNHYFTRCSTKVTTESKYSEYCGKACSRERTETIETER